MGGVKDFFWALEADSYQVDVIYYLCNRKLTADSLANIPYNEQPTEEILEGYVQRHEAAPNLAWGPKFPELAAWLNDYTYRQREKSKDTTPGPGSEASAFGFSR